MESNMNYLHQKRKGDEEKDEQSKQQLKIRKISEDTEDFCFVISQRRKEAQLFLEQYKKNAPKDIKVLKLALELDNTNSDIVFEYLLHLSKTNEDEFINQFKWRKIFLTQTQISILQPKDIFASLSSRQIYENIIQLGLNKENLDKDDNKWINKTKQVINQYHFEIPYLLRFQKYENNMYHYSRDKNDVIIASFIDRIEPNVPFEINTEEQFYIYNLLILSNRVKQITVQYILQELLFTCHRIHIKKLPFETYKSILNKLFNARYDIELTYAMNSVLTEIGDTSELQTYTNCSKEINYHLLNTKFDPYVDDVKQILQTLMVKLISSTCIRSLLQEIFPKYQDLFYLLNKNFIRYAFSVMDFRGCFNLGQYGYTSMITNTITINTEYRQTFGIIKEEQYLFYYTFIWFITIFHEIIGHFARRYLFYYTNGKINNKTERDFQIENDGGQYLEELLFGKSTDYHLNEILFLFDINNWNYSFTEFKSKLLSIKNEQLKEKELKKIINNNDIVMNILYINNCSIESLIQYCELINVNIEKSTNAFSIMLRKRVSCFDIQE